MILSWLEMPTSALVNSLFPQRNLPSTQGLPSGDWGPSLFQRTLFTRRKFYHQSLPHLLVEFRIKLPSSHKGFSGPPMTTCSHVFFYTTVFSLCWPKVPFSTFCLANLPNARLPKTPFPELLSVTGSCNSFLSFFCQSSLYRFYFLCPFIYPQLSSCTHTNTFPQLLHFLNSKRTSS